MLGPEGFWHTPALSSSNTPNPTFEFIKKEVL